MLPAPSRPDSDSREKLQKLRKQSLTKKECTKMKPELEATYFSVFKKTFA